MDLTGKLAWVTGAGSGIGKAVAVALAAAGATVVLSGRRPQPLAEVSDSIVAAGGKARAIAGDLSAPATAALIVTEIEASFGRLDILVNNAGLNIPSRDWASLTPDAVSALIGGNLNSAFYASVAVLPVMRRQRSGLIVNTASIAGKTISAMPGAAYTAAKHGVVAMSHTINLEENRNGIRSTAICPAEVATAILDQRPTPVSLEQRSAMLQPEDIASLVLYIAGLPPRVCLTELTITPLVE